MFHVKHRLPSRQCSPFLPKHKEDFHTHSLQSPRRAL
jgi:hypothetical protein